MPSNTGMLEENDSKKLRRRSNYGRPTDLVRLLGEELLLGGNRSSTLFGGGAIMKE